MAMIQCPECGKEVSDKAKACVHCGYPLEDQTTMKCPECGKSIPKTAASCPHCGYPMRPIIGSVIIQTSSDGGETANRYYIYDKQGNLLAELYPGQEYRDQISSNTIFCVRLTGYVSVVEVTAYADQENRFFAAKSGIGFSVKRVD